MKTKMVKKFTAVLFIFQTVILYSQEFGNFKNVEDLFFLTKSQVENKIKDYGYQLESKDRLGALTYSKKHSIYTSTVNLLFKNNMLVIIGWNDTLMSGQFIVKDIGDDPTYKFDESKTNDYLGVFTSISKEKGFQVSIFKTQPNLNKGMISFTLMSIGNKKRKISTDVTSKITNDSNTNQLNIGVEKINSFPIYTYNKLINKDYYEDGGSIFSEQFKEYYFLYGVVKKVINKDGYNDYEIHITAISKEFDDLHSDMESFENKDIILSLEPDGLYNKSGNIKNGWKDKYDLSFDEYKKLRKLLVEGRKIKFSYVEGGIGTTGAASAGIFYFNYIEKID